jgi:outer membrane protein TolC
MNTRNRWKIARNAILVTSIFYSLSVYGSEVTYPELWSEIERNSSLQKSKYLEWKAALIAKERSEKHWLPKIYTDLRSYQTNDPALNLLGKLGQRSATEADFSTASGRLRPGNLLDSNNQPYTSINSQNLGLFSSDTLNRPGSNQYARGTLGMDLPLYEGGTGTKKKELALKKWEGLQIEWQAIRKSEFAQSGYLYRGIQTLQESLDRLKSIETKLDKFLSRYQLSNRANPVGYSGYLALSNLSNRIKLTKQNLESMKSTFERSLEILSGLSKVEPKPQDLETFLDEFFPFSERLTDSKSILAYQKFAEIEKLNADMENAKFEPKIGLYSEAYAFQGSRDLASSYTAGVYLQMNLYNPADSGSVAEANLKAESAYQAYLEKRKMEIQYRENLIRDSKTAKENLKILNLSWARQMEQIQIIQNLYQNGSITAGQYAEALSQALDLNERIHESELEWIQSRTELSIFSTEDTVPERKVIQ